MRLRNALLAATVLAAPGAFAPGAAVAEPVSGIYVGAGAGGNYLEDYDVNRVTVAGFPGQANLNTGDKNSLRLRTNWGFVGLGSIGYGFGNGLRAEIEGNYRQNSIRKYSGTRFPTTSGGDIQTYGGMVNVLYDFDFANFGLPDVDTYLPHPYVGIGVGYAATTLRGFRASAPGYSLTGRNNPEDGNLAYQAIAGIAYPIDAVPGLSLTLEYRFFGVKDGDKFDLNQTSNGVAGTARGTVRPTYRFDSQYNHSVLLGVRYAFDAAPPPPPPSAAVAPAQAPTRSYLVFFDWDRADLTSRARQIISEAAQNSTRVQYTKIEVNGYTDTSGTAAYNQRLSVRRAQAVAAELVRDGVPRNAIAIQGFGETKLLVPTAQGVREPQNRRVEIIIR